MAIELERNPKACGELEVKGSGNLLQNEGNDLSFRGVLAFLVLSHEIQISMFIGRMEGE